MNLIIIVYLLHWSTFEQQFSEICVMLNDSRLVFHTDFNYVISFFRSVQVFFYLTLKIYMKIYEK